LGLWQSGLLARLNLDFLQNNRAQLEALVDQNWLLSATIFVLIYILVITLSLPGGAILTLAGGFLFGWAGLPLVVLGATTGATINFWLARYLLGEWVQTKYAKQLKKFNQDLATNGPNYLLSIRLVPAFPFWLINLLAGLTKLRTIDYLWATALGILPGTAAYIFAGTELARIGSTDGILSPGLILALLALAALSLAPVLWSKIKKKRPTTLPSSG